MSKAKIIFVLLLGLTLAYPFMTYYLVQAYELERAAIVKSYPEALRPYVDPSPFTGSLCGFLTLLFGTCIAVSWFIFFLWRK